MTNPDSSLMAKSLKAHLLQAHGIDLKHSHAVAAIAAALGHRDQHALAAANARGAARIAPAPADGVRTHVTLLDRIGNIIESAAFASEGEAAEHVRGFVEISADGDWEEQGGDGPGPASYTIQVDFENGGARRAGGAASLPPEDRERLLVEVENAVYAAAAALTEAVEHGRRTIGNGHHAAQRIAREARERLESHIQALRGRAD